MAIAGDITIANLVTQALKQAGRTTPSTAQITDATNFQFRRVKSDIASYSGRHEVLLKQAVTATVDGVQKYAWPTDAHYMKSVVLLDGPDEWRGTATAGATTSITLAASLDVSDANQLRGRWLATTGGTGASQITQIVGWDNGTKVATVEPDFITATASGTTYLIANDHTKLWHRDKATEWDTLQVPSLRGRALRGSMSGRNLWLEYTPDKIYVLWWDYWAYLDRLDDAGSVVLGHIREYYSLWSQGLTAWLCQRYDEDRYETEMAVYKALLDSYASEAAQVTSTQFFDV